MPWVALDGGIAAGKTTTLRYLQDAGVAVLMEPVGDHTANKRRKWDVLLDAVHAKQPGAAFAFQERVVADRALSKLATQMGQSKTSWACLERSPDMQRRTFVRMQGFDAEEEAQVDALYEEASRLWRPAGIIYLRMQPAVAHERTISRGRACEADVGLEYHTRLHDMHEAAVDELQAEGLVPVTIIDTTDDDEDAICAAVAQAYEAFANSRSS